MARYKNYDQSQGQFLTINFKKQLIPGTFEHTLNFLIDEKMDLSSFDKRFKNDQMGAPAYDPKVMLKIILYAYSKGIIWSRKIAELCRTNIIVKALTADTQPHFTVIADFVSNMKEEIKTIFTEVLMICGDLGLLGKQMFAVDGCKLPSNASKEWSGKLKDLKKKQEKLNALADMLIEKHKTRDVGINDQTVDAEKLQKQLELINK